MNAAAKTEREGCTSHGADEVSVELGHALEENARLARATMLAIDQYVETMVRFLTAGPGGPLEARRRATLLGLHRLEEFLSRRMNETGLPTLTESAPESAVWEKNHEDTRSRR